MTSLSEIGKNLKELDEQRSLLASEYVCIMQGLQKIFHIYFLIYLIYISKRKETGEGIEGVEEGLADILSLLFLFIYVGI